MPISVVGLDGAEVNNFDILSNLLRRIVDKKYITYDELETLMNRAITFNEILNEANEIKNKTKVK